MKELIEKELLETKMLIDQLNAQIALEQTRLNAMINELNQLTGARTILEKLSKVVSETINISEKTE
jgi:hypothetical protein